MKGKVKMFNTARGFGFITGDDSKDVYVHSSAVAGGAALAIGDAVEYEVEQSDRGPRAKNVKKASASAAPVASKPAPVAKPVKKA